MSRFEQIVAGFLIFKKYPGPDICAEHDIIYLDCDGDMDASDAKALEEAGWSVSDVGGWEHFA